MSYIPTYSGDPVLANEFQSISRAIQELMQNIFPKTYEAPEKPQEGMIKYADGTEWDPGSGAGFYAYQGGSWTQLGSGATSPASDEARIYFLSN